MAGDWLRLVGLSKPIPQTPHEGNLLWEYAPEIFVYAYMIQPPEGEKFPVIALDY